MLPMLPLVPIVAMLLIALAPPPADPARLSEALKAVAAVLPDDVSTGIDRAHHTGTRPDQKARARAYLAALRRGVPVVLCDSAFSEAVTRAAAQRLPRAECEAWLRSALDVVTDADQLARFNQEHPVSLHWKSVAVAVWNLSTDPNARLDAKQLWDAQQLRLMKGDGLHATAPLPDWNLPAKERCADR